jgi:hypothetical protein
MDSERKPFLTWLIFITAVGAALRMFRLNEIPFTYDELSALSRTHFNSFHDLIQKGVAGDGHPAGVQVFLYYWVKIFGYQEWAVKLPFILMGILCIPLIYQIGRKWFGKSEGIIAACLMAGLQYPVMYSQIARPYISGLFLILLLAVIWNSVMAKATVRNLFAFAVVLALCAYNHYFSLLTAAGIVATGLFVIDRKYLLKYMLAILFSVALCLPHSHVFLQQLQLKGLEWVPAPTPGFFKNYLYYIFNFSDYILVAVTLLLAQGIYFYTKSKPPVKLKFRLIALLWFAIPAAIGYFYSVYRAPVLETSVLIFGFPFLLLFICSFVTLPTSYFRDIEIGVLLLILIVSLGWERSYYKLFYHAETEMFARHIAGYEKAYGNGRVIAVVNTNPEYLDTYKKKYNSGWSYQTFESIGDNPAWRRWLEKSDAKYLILCNPPIEWGSQYLAIAREYYNCVDSIYQGFTTDIYVLKKGADGCKPDQVPLFSYTLNDSTGVRVKYKVKPSVNEAKGIYVSCDPPGAAGLFFTTARQLGFGEKLRVNISADVYVDSTKPEGCLTLKFSDREGRVLEERESLIQSFAGNDTGWHTVYLTARLYHAPSVKKVAFISADLYGKPETCTKFKNFKVEVVPDNPVLYSLIKK